MSQLEFNKECLLHLAQKMTKQNFSFPKNISLKPKQNNPKEFLYTSFLKENFKLNSKDPIKINSEENRNRTIKKGKSKLKNKYLENKNIQINEEKMLHLLSERKRKIKMALSQGNDKFKKNVEKARLIYINLDKKDKNSSHNAKVNYSNESAKLKKTNLFNLNGEHSKHRELLKNKILQKSIFTSNSDYFDNINKNLLQNNFSMSTKNNKFNNSVNSNMIQNITLNKKKINYSRNGERIRGNLSSNIKNFGSFDKENNNKYIEIYDKTDKKNNIEDNHYERSKINNNININISINNNMNNNNLNDISKNNKIKKIDNTIIRSNRKPNNRILQPNKYISYRQSISRVINNNINEEFHSFNDSSKAKEYNSGKIIKKYISHKIYYLDDTKKFINNSTEILQNKTCEDDKSNIKINNVANIFNEYNNTFKIRNRRENTFGGNVKNSYKQLDHNTYNINVNFISNQNNSYFSNINYLNYNNTSKMPNNSKFSRQKEIIDLENISYLNSPRKISKIIVNENNKNKIFRTHQNTNNIISNSRKNATKFNKSNQISNTIYKDNKKYSSLNEFTNSKSISNNKKDIIQLEDLLILEGKLIHLLDCLKYENPFPKICVEWWHFYTYSSFFGKFPKLFPKINKDKQNSNNNIISDYQIAHDSLLFEILSMIITYQILNDPQKSQNSIDTIKNLIKEIHQNFLIECDYILSKINNQSLNNIWIKKLKNIILAKRSWIDQITKETNYHLDLLNQGNKNIQNLITFLLNSYSKENSNNIDINSLTYFNKNISKIRLFELSGYFNKVINEENKKMSKNFSILIKKNINSKKNQSVVEPYLPEEIEGKKKFTLVLDLDETLICFRFNEKKRGIVKIRPGLHKFLKAIRNKYELIVFTAGTQEYADPIIDIIEKNEKYFYKRLYRQHTNLINNIYIKDLAKLGRDLSKTIIVDNVPQNFSLQKENGILIKNFFGQEKNDTALNDLTHILLKIASNPHNDVRKEIKKNVEEIFTKITTNLNY